MHSSALTQKPTLILPASRIKLVAPEPKRILPKNKLSDRQIAEFRKTADAISQPPWSLVKAASYLTTLCDENVVGTQGVPPQLSYFLTPADALEGLQKARDNAGPPEDILNFAPGTPRKVVATLRSVAEDGDRQQHQTKGRGRGGKGRGRKGRQNLCAEPAELAEPVPADPPPPAEIIEAAPANPAAPAEIPEVDAEAPRRPPRKKRGILQRPAAAVESSDAAQSSQPAVIGRPAAAADLDAEARDAEAPPVPVAPLAAPSGKRYRESTIDQQSSLGCSKCKYQAQGCARCIEIHNLWKAKNAVDID